jgi:hypothetical protein
MPMVPVLLAELLPPKAVVNCEAGADTLKRMGRPLEFVSVIF